MECHSCKIESDSNLLDYGCGHLVCKNCVTKHCDGMIERRSPYTSYLFVPCFHAKCGIGDQYCPIPMVLSHLSPNNKILVERIIKTTLPKKIPEDPCPRNFTFPLESFGYHFDSEQRLRHIQTGDPYYWVNGRHYKAIGESVMKYIQNILVQKYGLKEYFCDPKGINNIFRSENGYDKLMMIIPGFGMVGPGQWTRGLCIYDSLKTGSCIDYVDFALKNKYDVILLNPNCVKFKKKLQPVSERYNWTEPIKEKNIEEHEKSINYFDDTFEKVENNESALQHISFVYEKFVNLNQVKHLFIVAHSLGGRHTMDFLKFMARSDKNKEDQLFKKQMVCIGFTDSTDDPYNMYRSDIPEIVREFVSQRAKNWKSSKEELDVVLKESSENNCIVVSAGHERHEYSSSSCMKSLFKYFDEELQKKNFGNFD